MTNLIAVDSQTVSDLFSDLNMVWAAPLQIIIVIYMLWKQLGISAFVGVATMIIFIPLNSFLAKKSKQSKSKKLKVQDNRIKMINEILAGIKVIKLYGWELSFRNIVNKIRQLELKYLKINSMLNVVNTFSWTCAPLVVSVSTFSTFVLIDKDNVLTASNVFVSLAYFNLLRMPLTQLPDIISAFINANVALKRIRGFLLSDEINPNDVTDFRTPGVAIRVEDADLGYDKKEPYLKNLNLEVRKGELVAVVGEVGSGKSSLLYGVLGEMNKLNNGTINIDGSRAYVAQQAWIQNATVKDNILFGREYDEKIYDHVLKASCLISDLNIMPAGKSILCRN